MNKIKNFVFTFVALLAVQFVALAQDIIPGEPGADGVNTDPEVGPIDTYIWVLLLVGLVYVFYKYKNHIKLNTFSNN